MDLNLSNKNALVCGSSKGIGKATAIELSKLGASITLVSRNADLLDEGLKTLDTSQGQDHGFLVADFSDTTDLKKRVKTLVSKKTIHILINNTGGPPGGAIREASVEAFLNAYTQHLIANHLLAQIVLEGMKKAQYGRIVNIISTSVKQPIPSLGVSNTTRGAVASWAKTLAGEVGEHGITVNNVLPGFTATTRLSEIIDNKANKTGLSTEEVITQMKASVPARRFADASEIGAVAAFLATPAAAYVNGTNVVVDGGRTGCL